MQNSSKKKLFMAIIVGTNLALAAFVMAKEIKAVAAGLGHVPQGATAQDAAQLRKKAIVQLAGLTHEDELQECYESFLRREPRIEEGVVEVHWMLDPTGKVSSLQMVRSDLEDPTFTQCVLEQVKRMTFQAPPKARPTLVAHKFNFHKRSPASVDFK